MLTIVLWLFRNKVRIRIQWEKIGKRNGKLDWEGRAQRGDSGVGGVNRARRGEGGY